MTDFDKAIGTGIGLGVGLVVTDRILKRIKKRNYKLKIPKIKTRRFK